MLRTAYRLTANLFNARFRPRALIHPLFVVYHITNLCNLRCFYCEDFSADKNHLYKPYELSTDQVKEILRILRKKFDYIYITGGEPYVRGDLEELVVYMKEIGFKRISLNTNALTLDQKPEILKHVRDLVISIDSMNAERKDEIIGCKKGGAQKIFDNLRWAARQQKKYGYEVSINCVVAPHTLQDAREVLEFALQEGIRYSCIPQNVDYSVHAGLNASAEYKQFIEEIIDLKDKTPLISGTRYFFKNILKLSPFECYPSVVARVNSNGDVSWPCRPLKTIAGNLLEIGSFDATVREGIRKHGILNACDKNCQVRCYIESSLLVKHPLALVKEFFTGVKGASPLANPSLQQLPTRPEAILVREELEAAPTPSPQRLPAI